jgi:hypothetical protein
MEIVVEIKNIYGNRMIYPACSKAKVFAYIAGSKTLTPHAIEAIKCLGYEVRVEQKEIVL